MDILNERIERIDTLSDYLDHLSGISNWVKSRSQAYLLQLEYYNDWSVFLPTDTEGPVKSTEFSSVEFSLVLSS